ncbi:hypothetical protein GGI35DRAFT_264764 [Trichoderma velutinum]
MTSESSSPIYYLYALLVSANLLRFVARNVQKPNGGLSVHTFYFGRPGLWYPSTSHHNTRRHVERQIYDAMMLCNNATCYMGFGTIGFCCFFRLNRNNSHQVVQHVHLPRLRCRAAESDMYALDMTYTSVYIRVIRILQVLPCGTMANLPCYHRMSSAARGLSFQGLAL